MLNIIKGESGSGKTTYITNLLANMVKNGEKNILYIVPDQSSFDTQRTFLDLLGSKDSLNINVQGFTGLCDYIFSVNGSSGKIPLDDGGKAIIMSLAIDECQDNLPLFSHTKNKNELINLMLSAVSEYKTCNITSEKILETASEIEDETLRTKLKETCLIRDTFDALVIESYVDPDDYITQGYNSLLENNIFKDYIIALDSFSGFTNVELEFLSKLMVDAKDFYITVNTDSTNNNELFFTTERTVNQLKKIARDNDVKIASPIVLAENHRFETSELIPILKNVYRIEKTSLDQGTNNIILYESKNKYTECDFVARNIRELIIDNDYTYQDIAVIYRQDNSYDGIIDSVFDKYNIPYFMDKEEDIFTKPLIKLVSSILETINNSYQRENVLNILKSGLMPFTSEEISLFENYILMWDIKGSNFKNDFVDNPQGLVSDFSDDDRKTLEIINKVRQGVINPLVDFQLKSKDTNATTITKNLYNLLLNYNIPESIVSMCETLEESGNLPLSEEQRRLWEILMNILDKMINLLSDKKLSLKEYTELLMLQFNNSTIAFIPKAMDEVVVSGVERVRMPQKKAVFVIGCNEGIFPQVPSANGVFTDSERKILLEKGMEVNDSVDELNYKEMYLAYYALTLPSHKLFVSYSTSNLQGELLTPSSLVREVKEIYPKVTALSDYSLTADDMLWSKNSAFQFVANNIKSNSITEKTLENYFSQEENYKEKIATIKDTLQDNPIQIKDENIAEKLFGKDLFLSASQVETYHLCKFKYFCQYGLKAEERKKAEIDSLQYGTLTHYLLERFLREYKKTDFASLSNEDIAKIISQYLNDYAVEELGGIDNKPARFKYLFYRIQDNAIKLLIHIIKELSQSEFVPTAFELNVGKDIPAYKLTLDDGSSLSVRGSVDRVDVMDKNGEKYIRVIDYKTGSKTFKIGDIMYGLNLQMLIYLSAIKANGKNYFGDNIVPCGVLYQPAKAKFVSSDDKNDSEKNLNEFDKNLRMNGIILNNDSVIIGMDSTEKGKYIPVKKSSRGGYTGADYLYDLSELGKIFKNIDDTLTEMAKTLHKGNIEYNPTKDFTSASDNYDACKYCPYLSICGYEDGKNCRNIAQLSRKEVMKMLQEEEEENA